MSSAWTRSELYPTSEKIQYFVRGDWGTWINPPKLEATQHMGTIEATELIRQEVYPHFTLATLLEIYQKIGSLTMSFTYKIHEDYNALLRAQYYFRELDIGIKTLAYYDGTRMPFELVPTRMLAMVELMELMDEETVAAGAPEDVPFEVDVAHAKRTGYSVVLIHLIRNHGLPAGGTFDHYMMVYAYLEAGMEVHRLVDKIFPY